MYVSHVHFNQNGGPLLICGDFYFRLDKLKVISRGGQTFVFSKKSRWMAGTFLVIFQELRGFLVQGKCACCIIIWHFFVICSQNCRKWVSASVKFEPFRATNVNFAVTLRRTVV